MAPKTVFRSGTARDILAAHNAGLEYWAGTGSRIWATDSLGKFHHVHVFRPRGRAAEVVHDCKGFREIQEIAFQAKCLNAVPSTDSEMAAITLLLSLGSWDCRECGPRFPVDESLLDEAIDGFIISSEADEAASISQEA